MRNVFTFGGLSTKEEMCMDFLWYYPRNNKNHNTVSVCVEEFDEGAYLDLWKSLNKTSKILNFTLNTIQSLQSVFINQTRLGSCITNKVS